MDGYAITLTPNATAVAVCSVKGTVSYPTKALIKNPSTSGSNMFVGGADVDDTTGFLLEAGESVEVELVNAPVYVAATTGTPNCYVLVH